MMFQDAPQAKNGPVEIAIKSITRLFNQAKKHFQFDILFGMKHQKNFKLGVNKSSFNLKKLTFAVPQGSILKSFLLNRYICGLQS